MNDEIDDLKARRSEIEGTVVNASRSTDIRLILAIGAAMSVAGIGAFVLFSALDGEVEADAPIPTSEATEFPDDRDLGDTLALPEQPMPIIVERSVVSEVPDSATLARLEELEADLAEARETIEARENETEAERQLRENLERERTQYEEQIRSLRSSAQNDQERMEANIRRLESQLSRLQTNLEQERNAAVTARARAENDAQRQATELRRLETELRQTFQQEQQALINAYEQRLQEAEFVDPLEQERLALAAAEQRLEQERLARLENQRTLQEALFKARVNSGMLAVGTTGSEEAGAREPRALSVNESFVQRVIEDVPVSTASQIANPQATILQGTIIQAALEVAIDSSLPGQIRAVVSENVYSLDGSATLIPAGSKVFGEYSAGIITGQRRILIAWTRITTPDNRSVNIASYGADRLGRSGTGGAVDTRFAERFGGAALISIIGAAPALAAAEMTDDQDTQEVIEDVGTDFQIATQSAVNDILSISPVIYVKQGAAVSIIVDRDLEFF